jgi:hypothetical protein
MFRSFAMRINVWLVVLSVGLVAHHLIAAPAEGAPPETASVSASLHEDAVVIDPPYTPPLPRPVNVRVYRSPEVSFDVLRAALNVAASTFAAASVNVVWKVCGPGECQTPPSPAERLVRLVRSPKGMSHDTRCLGDALIDSQKGTGVLATVYVDRVIDLVRRLDIDHPTLLGRTIAHEIGHLLLATNSHAKSGLMRELWSPEELVASKSGDWSLRPLEAAAIRRRLT